MKYSQNEKVSFEGCHFIKMINIEMKMYLENTLYQFFQIGGLMTIYNINGPNPLQRIMPIPTHAFVTSVQINHFCDFRYDYPLWHLVK
jgi:hypothetical protein